MIKVTGLWLKLKDGKPPMMVGSVGSLRVLIFKNQLKVEAQQPDYILYIDEAKPSASAVEKEANNDVPF